jgi:hypothetical protein
MPPALPFWEILLDKPQVSLIDKRSRLQRVIRPLPPQIAVSQLAKLVVYDRHQLVERGMVSSAPAQQELCDLIGGRRSHNFQLRWLAS